MRPVMQTRDGWPEGNCLMAATASLLGCDLADLPDLYDEGERRGGHETHWWGVYLEALLDRGWSVACIPNGIDGYPVVAPRGWSIASLGDGPGHAAVALNGQIVHDPHPSKPARSMPIRAWYVLVAVTTP